MAEAQGIAMNGLEYLGKLVVARTAQGGLAGVGSCFSYCEAPTVALRTPDGKTFHWRADLCEVIADEEVAAALTNVKCDG